MVQRLFLAAAFLATAITAPIATYAQPAHAISEPRDICAMLGGRSDRGFAGRPGNLYAVVGPKSRLIYMAGDLSANSSLFRGKIVEWRPDYVQLEPETVSAPDGRLVDGVRIAKFCWVGPSDSLLAEYVLENSTTGERSVRLSFDLQGVSGRKSLDGGVLFTISDEYPRSVLPRLLGALSATQPVTFSGNKLWADVSIPAGRTVRSVFRLAVSPDEARLRHSAPPAAEARAENTRYWNQMLTREIPLFACSDPFMEKLYYFRWWSLLNKMNVGGFGHWSKPLAREGTVAFNALITYSGAPNTIDLRWMRSPEWAYGNIQSFYGNLHDGKLANHIYPDSLDGDLANNAPGHDGAPIDFPYHNFLVKALADTYALHPDKAVLWDLWPALERATGLYDRELDADHNGLYETCPWSNITGQEWCARFLYFHPYDQLLAYNRSWNPKDDADAARVADIIQKSVLMPPGVKIPRTAAEMRQQVDRDRHYRQETLDENCYAYADLTAMAEIAEILDEKEARNKWRAEAKRTRAAVLKKLWDPATRFFYDQDEISKEWSRVKSPTGFYPFWAGIAEKRHLPIFQHLFNTNEFWTPFPVPTISMDYPGLEGLRRNGWTYWNGNNWPMTTSHVVDAAARAAKDLDPTLATGAAELLRRYTRVHFIHGDLQRPCVSEYFDPVTGEPNAPTLDYAHSYYIDLIMRHVVGVEADPLSDEVRVNPLNLGLERFEARNIWVKGHDLSVTWAKGLFAIKVDGKLTATAPKLKPLKIHLRPVPEPASSLVTH